MFDKCEMHLPDVRRAVESVLLSGKSVNNGLDMTRWTYRTDCEVAYVAALAGLPAEQMLQWRGRYCVSPDPICFWKAYCPAHFQYETPKGLDYWDTAIQFECRELSTLGPCLPALFRCAKYLNDGPGFSVVADADVLQAGCRSFGVSWECGDAGSAESL